MPARATSNDAHLLKLAELLFGDLHIIQKNLSGVLGNSAEERVTHGPGLLENLLLHEMLVATLLRHDGVPGDMLRRALDRTSIMIHDPYALRGEHGDVTIGKEENLAGMLEEGRNVAGDKVLSFAETDDGWGALARGHNFLRVFRREENQSVDAAQLIQRPTHSFLEGDATLRILFNEVRHDFRIRLCREFMARFLQLFLEFEIVFDDSVVNDHDLAGAVAVRVGVFFGGAAVGSPARVADAVGALDG